MVQLVKYVFYDILRTRFIVFYTIFLLLSTVSLFQLDSDPGKVVMSLMNIALMVVPLVSVVFATIHFYNSYEFIELMLAQPVDRKTVFLAEYVGLASSLCVACLIGIGAPLLFYNVDAAAVTLLVCSIILSLVFTSLAFLASVLTRDKAKAIGIALLFWFYFALIYDAFVLWIIYTFNEYPLEMPTVALISLNPIDLTRIIMLLQLDISALMGYTGAFYKKFFDGGGLVYSLGVLILWIGIPLFAAVRIFNRKDL
jgi:Cu-processing system permease protein